VTGLEARWVSRVSGQHVLFIGNSLTYTNDLPGTVAALASQVSDTIRVQSVALPNLALIDHVNGSSSAVDMIYEGITGHDARLLPARGEVSGRELSTNSTTVRMLQQVAHETVLRYEDP
jgi:hypothetical protein